jgi:hypothetical protein
VHALVVALRVGRQNHLLRKLAALIQEHAAIFLGELLELRVLENLFGPDLLPEHKLNVPIIQQNSWHGYLLTCLEKLLDEMRRTLSDPHFFRRLVKLNERSFSYLNPNLPHLRNKMQEKNEEKLGPRKRPFQPRELDFFPL